MTTIFGTIFVFGLIVFVHELGHFITAKWSKMRVDEFAIGFGPALWKKQYGETLYSIRAIPLGGYNKIAGMDPAEKDDPGSFQGKPVWKRFIVISAGAMMNFILAIVLFFGLFATVGTSIPSDEAIVGKVQENSPAAAAKFEDGDRILSIGGVAVAKWKDMSPLFTKHMNEVVDVVVERNQEQQVLSVIPKGAGDRAIIGIYPGLQVQTYSVGEAFDKAVTSTFKMISDMFSGVWRMVSGKEEANLSGPIGIAQLAGEAANLGIVVLLQLTAVLSVNLGVLNLLPVPMLDGGYLVMLIVEGITGKRLSAKTLEYIQMTGLIILMTLFIYSTSSDITRLFK